MTKNGVAGKWLFAAIPMLFLAGCEVEETISYSNNVKPILDRNCIECHQEGGSGFEASGFGMTSYEDLMKGTKFGPMVIAGDSAGSTMVVLMEGRADPSISMPHGGKQLSDRLSDPFFDQINFYTELPRAPSRLLNHGASSEHSKQFVFDGCVA